MATQHDQIQSANAAADKTQDTQQAHELPFQKFYDTELLEMPAGAGKLLEDYSKIPRDDILPHILQVRDHAWKTYPHPSIGQFGFLELHLSKCKAYPEILQRIKAGQQFLDMGCGFGQELRQLVADGAGSENLYGVDQHADFFDMGYELFGDKSRFNGLLLAGNVFSNEGVIWQLDGKIDVLWCGTLLHHHDWAHQVAAVRHMLRLLNKHPNSIVVGRALGSARPGAFPAADGSARLEYRHDVQSFRKMFHEAADALDQKWEMEVDAHEYKSQLALQNPHFTPQVGLLEVSFIARKLERLDAATSHHFVF